MSRYPGNNYLQVPSSAYDGPSDTRSQGSHHSSGSRSHSRRTSQVSGSHVSASHPGSQAPGSAPPSNVGAPSGPVGSRPPSNVGGRSPPRGYPEPLGFDPAREPKKFGEDFNKNIDLPPEAYVAVSITLQDGFLLRRQLTPISGQARHPVHQASRSGQHRTKDQRPDQPVPCDRNAFSRHHSVRCKCLEPVRVLASCLTVCDVGQLQSRHWQPAHVLHQEALGVEDRPAKAQSRREIWTIRVQVVVRWSSSGLVAQQHPRDAHQD